MAVLEEALLKVKVPAQQAANRKDFSSKPHPCRGPEASLASESGYVPFKAFGNVTALVAGQPSAKRFVPRGPPWAGSREEAGQGSGGGVKGYSAHHVGR